MRTLNFPEWIVVKKSKCKQICGKRLFLTPAFPIPSPPKKGNHSHSLLMRTLSLSHVLFMSISTNIFTIFKCQFINTHLFFFTSRVDGSGSFKWVADESDFCNFWEVKFYPEESLRISFSQIVGSLKTSRFLIYSLHLSFLKLSLELEQRRCLCI